MTRFPKSVVTSGSGPYPEHEFDAILRTRGVDLWELGTESESVIILGRHAWNEDSLNRHIESRRGMELRIYSQEMFLAYIATDKDPYDQPPVLEAFGRDHPALEFVSNLGFDWPTTRIVPGVGILADDGDPENWPQVGLLSYLGYRVGANGISAPDRQRILRNVFESSVPNVQSVAYMNQWGEPLSSARLQKLANSIATFARNAQRRAAPPYEAISEWESDLAWLETTFYRGVFRFTWPSTYVR